MGRRLFQRRHFFKEDIDYQQAHETVRHCFPGAAVVGNLPANARDEGDSSSIPGSGRSPGVGNVNLLQYSCLGNPMDRGAWGATVHGGHKKLDMIDYSTAYVKQYRDSSILRFERFEM